MPISWITCSKSNELRWVHDIIDIRSRVASAAWWYFSQCNVWNTSLSVDLFYIAFICLKLDRDAIFAWNTNSTHDAIDIRSCIPSILWASLHFSHQNCMQRRRRHTGIPTPPMFLPPAYWNLQYELYMYMYYSAPAKVIGSHPALSSHKPGLYMKHILINIQCVTPHFS